MNVAKETAGTEAGLTGESTEEIHIYDRMMKQRRLI